MSLAFIEFPLDEVKTMNALKEINANANLLEILREKIEQHDPNAKVETESII